MLLWVFLALMSAAVVAMLLNPLLARGPVTDASPGDDGSAAVYRDQLAEIEAEAGRGLIGADEAENARREIARRLLASASPDGTVAQPTTATARSWPAPRHVGIVLGALLPVAALAIYLQTGAPSLPSQPLAARRTTPPADADMAKLIAAVEARLKANPEDGRGWDVIAPVYLRLGRHGDAANAFRQAIRLLGEAPRRLGGLAEALMLADEGRIGPEVRGVLGRMLELDPKQPQARFWIAFAKEQDGEHAAAAAEYEQLLKDAPAEVAWRPMLEERLKAVRAAAGGDQGASPAPPAGTAPPAEPGGAGGRGPTAADIAAAERMSATERQAMIGNMVSGLAARLEADGRDLAGWQKLIRALMVLGRKDDATAALEKARKSLADEPTALAALADLAKDLGLGT